MGVDGPASGCSLLTAFSLITLGVAAGVAGPAMDDPFVGALPLRDGTSGVEGNAGVEAVGAKEDDERDSLSLSGATLCTCSFAMIEGEGE
jgi:hypothetical protein